MAETTENMLRKRLAEIRLLPPDKRAQAIKELEAELKKLEQQRKKEIEEAVESAEEIGQRTVDELEEIRKSIPEGRAVKIEELFAKKPGEQEAGSEELEKKVAGAAQAAAGAGGPSYARPFEELKTDFYKLIENSRPRLDELREKAAKGELDPEQQASFENYFHTFENFSQMTNYVSDGAREKFLSEERTLGSIAKYVGHDLPEAERRRRMAA